MIMSLSFTGDVDSRSIADQDRTKQHWEDQIATGDVSLFPKEPERISHISSSIDLTDFKSDVETQSIADLRSTKQAWEKLSEDREKEIQREKSILKSEDQMRKFSDTRYLNNNIYAYDSPPQDERLYENESAIDREIRLAQEREAELKREKEYRDPEKPNTVEQRSDIECYTSEDDMPIHKVPPPVRVVEVVPKGLPDRPWSPRSPQSPQSPLSPMSPVPPPAFQDTLSPQSESAKKESLIDREIRQQQEREEQMRQETNRKPKATNKVSPVIL